MLEGLHPTLVNRTNMLIALAREAGLEIKICQALRTFNEQAALYAQGRSKPGKVVTKAPAGFSWHNYGLAIDFCFKGPKPFDEAHPWYKIGEIGKGLGLKWGGDWPHPDRPHFQLTGSLSIRDALRLHKQGGIKAVWERIK